MLFGDMFLTVCFYASLVIFVLGTAYKVYGWLNATVGVSGLGSTVRQRFGAALKGIVSVIFSRKLFVLLEALILDVILGRRQFQVDKMRWIMHSLILWGFGLLFLFHALGALINPLFVSEYYSTLNPFWLLRDVFAVMVFAGVILAILRRALNKNPRLTSSGMDVYAIVIVAVIMCSGLSFQSLQMTSHSVFMDMVENWAGMDVDDDEEDIAGLEALWARDYALVSPNVSKPFDEDMLETGVDANENNCVSCHVSSKKAPLSYAFAKMLSPVAGALDKVNAVPFLKYLHLLACFLGLAYLPFSKMFHLVATPFSLMANRVMDENSNPVNVATRQAMELDACVHCCTCSLTCSAMMASVTTGNDLVLPSEKMSFLKKIACGKDLSDQELEAVSHGVYMCTNCDRCTVACPSGINLKDLWLSVREGLIAKDAPQPLVLTPLSFYRALNRSRIAPENYGEAPEKAQKAVAGRFDELTDKSGTVDLSQTEAVSIQPNFAYCFGCQTCTTVCPVVGSYDDPVQTLGLVPHQLMCALGMGQEEMASGASMIWDCLTCYQCQEQCPQNVPVTDILFELKNAAVSKVLPGIKSGAGKKP